MNYENKIIDGSKIAKQIRLKLKEEIFNIKVKQRTPRLDVFLVGRDSASMSYVNGKIKACEEVGVFAKHTILSENTTTEELLIEIEKSNKNESVDGILVQLPLPKHINEAKIIQSISKEKDVDGFTKEHIANLTLNNKGIVSCTPKGILTLLSSVLPSPLDLKGKTVVIIGRSNIVGKPIANLLLNLNATIIVCHSKTTDIESFVKMGDIVIVAVGKPKMVKKEWLKDDAIVIDVGINRMENGKLCGDVDFEDCINKVSYITPVPKGVGPMTIVSLLENTVSLYKQHLNIE